jgi:hypothetical protein
MTSLAGGNPSTVSSQDIVDAWNSGLKKLKAIHHQSGNFLVEIRGSMADVFCYGIATHYLPNRTDNNVRTFVGSYDLQLVENNSDWKINKFQYNLKYIDGNKELESNL